VCHILLLLALILLAEMHANKNLKPSNILVSVSLTKSARYTVWVCLTSVVGQFGALPEQLCAAEMQDSWSKETFLEDPSTGGKRSGINFHLKQFPFDQDMRIRSECVVFSFSQPIPTFIGSRGTRQGWTVGRLRLAKQPPSA
jgi:hypothetical protein